MSLIASLVYKLTGYMAEVCNSPFKYALPFILPLNPLNLLNWAVFFTIFFIILAISPNFTNSSDGKNRDGGRTFLFSAMLYYGIAVLYSGIVLFVVCMMNTKVHASFSPESRSQFIEEETRNIMNIPMAMSKGMAPQQYPQPVAQVPFQQPITYQSQPQQPQQQFGGAMQY